MKTHARTVAALTPAIVVALGAAAPVMAGPFDPAFRGQPNSVHAIFDWVDQGVPWTTTLFETGDNNTYPLDQTVPQAFDDGLNTTVLLPNFIDPLPLKDMVIQMAFDGPVPLELISLQVNAFDSAGTVTVIETGRDSSDPDLFWAVIDFQLRPNPDWEEIFIFGDTGANIVPGNLLIIEIDTISFPTPGAISVAAFAGLATVRRRRR